MAFVRFVHFSSLRGLCVSCFLHFHLCNSVAGVFSTFTKAIVACIRGFMMFDRIGLNIHFFSTCFTMNIQKIRLSFFDLTFTEAAFNLWYLFPMVVAVVPTSPQMSLLILLLIGPTARVSKFLHRLENINALIKKHSNSLQTLCIIFYIIYMQLKKSS